MSVHAIPDARLPSAGPQGALPGVAVPDVGDDIAFDDITALAAQVCGTAIALVVVDDGRQLRVRSHTGPAAPQWAGDRTLLAPALEGADVFVAADATQDPRFSGHALFMREPHLRFFAACPLITAEGRTLGLLCVIDAAVRPLTSAQGDALMRLARQAMHLIELHRARQQADDTQGELRRLALVAERTRNVVILSDAEGRATWTNDAFTQVTGFGAHELIGRKPEELLHFAGTSPDASGALREAIRHHRPCRVQLLHLSKQGRPYWTDVDLQPLHDGQGRCEGFVAVETDITELMLEREQSRTLLDALPVGVLLQGVDGVTGRVNRAAARILAIPESGLIGATTQAARWKTVNAEGKPLADDERPLSRVLQTGKATAPERVGIITPAGERRWLELSCVPLPGADGRLAGAITYFADVTDKVQADGLLRASMLAADLGPWSWEPHTNQWTLSLAWAERFGPGGQAPDWLNRVHPDDIAAALASLRSMIRGEAPVYRAEFRIRMRDNQYRWLLSWGAVSERGADGRVHRVTGVLMDIDERKRAEEKLAVAATTDALTGLPNRSLLHDRLGRALQAARRHDHKGALLYLDLDHFKRVNDSHGHPMGDALLKQVALRLRDTVRAEDTLARMGGDELMVLLPELGGDVASASLAAQQVADKLRQALSLPFAIGSFEFRIGASMGITVFPKSPTETAEDLVREADTAMYEAKNSERGSVRPFEGTMQLAVANRLSLERDLQRALAEDQLELHLQGKWSPDGRLAGAEALTRWNHPDRGEISPADFIPVAEDSGLILPLGRWVIEQACVAVRDARAKGHRWPIAINVSPRQFSDASFAGDLRRIIDAAGVQPSWLTLELTEGIVLKEGVASLMHELAAQGFGFAIDDFGTGYSNLMYLKRLPVHEIKIDRAFVRDIVTDPDDAVLVQAIIDIARNFEIATVAEGVETAEQAAFLTARGCRLLQGYRFDRPRLAADFIAGLPDALAP